MIGPLAALLVALGTGDDSAPSRSLAELVERCPDRARFVAYGADATGAPLWALRVGPHADVERPSVTIVPALDEVVEEALLVALACALCAAEDDGCDYWILANPVPGGPSLALATDFPSGWEAPADARGAFPLAHPETRAVAEHLAFQPRAAAVVELRSGPARASDGGTLLRFAREHLDLPALTLPVTEGGVHLAARVARIAAGRARLGLAQPVVRRLADELWEVELDVANSGRFAAAPARRRPAHPDRRIVLRARGPELLAGALRDPGGDFLRLPAAPERWNLGPLAGGDVLRLRMIVRGTPGELLTLDADAARAESARVVVELVATPTPTPR